MTRFFVRLRLAASVAVLLSVTSVHADDNLPAGATVLDTFVLKTGGKEAYGRIRNCMKKLRTTSPDGEVGVTIYQAEPYFKLVESKTPRGLARAGTNGEVAWRDGFMGTRVLSDERRDQEMLEAFFHMPLKWREVFAKVQCTEIVELKGTRCYKLLITPKFGLPQTRYFAVDTGLQKATERTVTTPLGKIVARIFMEDYRPVDGILYPHRMVQEVKGQQNSVITVDSIVHNLDIPPDKFALPEDVKELLKSR